MLEKLCQVGFYLWLMLLETFIYLLQEDNGEEEKADQKEGAAK